MKYLHYFENNNPELKKYIVVKSNDYINFFDDTYDYYILKFIGFDTDKNWIQTEFVYQYNNEDTYNKILNDYYELNLNKLNIVYQSNTLKDCIEKLSIISKSNKYNL
jgi:hypothetical protein